MLGVKDLHQPPPHDYGSILFSLNEVVQAIAAGRLDSDEAGRVLHELNLAGANLGGGDARSGGSGGEAFLEELEEDRPWQ